MPRQTLKKRVISSRVAIETGHHQSPKLAFVRMSALVHLKNDRMDTSGITCWTRNSRRNYIRRKPGSNGRRLFGDLGNPLKTWSGGGLRTDSSDTRKVIPFRKVILCAAPAPGISQP
jgi:hypothetical protein